MPYIKAQIATATSTPSTITTAVYLGKVAPSTSQLPFSEPGRATVLKPEP